MVLQVKGLITDLKLLFSNLYIYANLFHKLQTLHLVGLYSWILKFRRFTPSGCLDMGSWKLNCVVNSYFSLFEFKGKVNVCKFLSFKWFLKNYLIKTFSNYLVKHFKLFSWSFITLSLSFISNFGNKCEVLKVYFTESKTKECANFKFEVKSPVK